tara:strand:- start:476 stop:847 length:372 start_codon:yes stop_codon:yes gene_type:complete
MGSKKYYFFILGWICVALGIIGIFLPLMPTTIFLIIATWAFANSSPRWHRWLKEHPRLGPTIRAWEEQRAMSRQSKKMAWAALLFSYLMTAFFMGPLSIVSIIAGICIIGVAFFISKIKTLED